MGYNTTVVILNDALDAIAKDGGFGARLADEIKRSSFRPETPNDVSACGFCNAAMIIETHHSSDEVAVVVGHNTGRVQSPDEVQRAREEGYEAGREAERKREAKREENWLQVMAQLDHLSAEVAEALHETDREKIIARAGAVVDQVDAYIGKLGFGPEDSRLRRVREIQRAAMPSVSRAPVTCTRCGTNCEDRAEMPCACACHRSSDPVPYEHCTGCLAKPDEQWQCPGRGCKMYEVGGAILNPDTLNPHRPNEARKCECRDGCGCSLHPRNADFSVTRNGVRMAVCDRCELTGDEDVLPMKHRPDYPVQTEKKAAVVREDGKRHHILKTWPFPFEDVKAGHKPFDYRPFDRDFRVGDVLVLTKWEPTTERYSGEIERRRVTYLLPGGTFGVPVGYCVMGLGPEHRTDSASPLTGPELAAKYGFKPHGLAPEVAAGIRSETAVSTHREVWGVIEAWLVKYGMQKDAGTVMHEDLTNQIRALLTGSGGAT